MSYRDEMETLTGVPMGHTAFTAVRRPNPQAVELAEKRKHGRPQKRMSKAQLSISVLDSDAEKAEKRLEREERLKTERLAGLSTSALKSASQTRIIATRRKTDKTNGTLHGISRKADELVTEFCRRANAITAIKNVSSFNVAIASADESRRTQSIGGKL